MENLEIIEYRNYTIKINFDELAESPRFWENLGSLFLPCSNYSFTDRELNNNWLFKNWDNYFNSIFELAQYLINGIDYFKQNNYSNDFIETLENDLGDLQESEKAYCLVPLSLYIHSGIAIRESLLNKDIDGFIYITNEKFLAEYANYDNFAVNSKNIGTYLLNEIETYQSYINGECYFYEIFDKDNNLIDSCCGYYDLDFCIEDAKNYVDCEIKELQNLAWKQFSYSQSLIFEQNNLQINLAI